MTLDRKARDFVNTLSDVLNGSITDGIRIRFRGVRSGVAAAVGYQISKHDLVGKLIPVTLGKDPTCWLALNQTVTLEEEGHLKTLRARMAIFADEDEQHELVRYDFDREADNDYPTAHIQIDADSEALRILSARCSISDRLEDLHLPVGGVRFRPALEDLIRFLAIEGLAECRDGWEEVVDQARTDFHHVQLKAAVRNDPHVAVEQLKRMGYGVRPPDDE